MKILIVDDNTGRSRRLADSIVAGAGEREESIRIESNGVSARRAMSEEAFDLLLLDVLLPNRAGDDPSDIVSAAIVTELCETERLKRPARIIGITAYEDALRAASGVFGRYAWTIISASENESGWIEQIVNCVSYISNVDRRHAGTETNVDVLWLTALRRPEMEAVRRLHWNWRPERPVDDRTFVSDGMFVSNGKSLSSVSCSIDRMGMVSSAALTAKLVKLFQPKLCVMTGICAGIRGRAELGGVVLAETAWDYQSGKHAIRDTAQVFEVEPNFIQCAPSISSRFAQLAEDSGFLQELERGWPGSWPAKLALLKGPVASGSAVLADSSVTEKIRGQHRKVLGVDMEIYGVYVAAMASDPQPIFLAVKAVCDFADEQKSDDVQALASYASAFTAARFLERYGAELTSGIT
jgi:nucleoside phosphorylase/CheY-like chemotaxis protein